MPGPQRPILCVVLVLSCGLACRQGPDVRSEGSSVVVQTQDLEIRFEREGGWRGGFMVFGGADARMQNSAVHAVISLLDADHASAIMERYPDFHRCSSPGASLAKQRIRSIQLIGASGSVQREIMRVLDDHGDSVASGGDRVCVELEGSPLRFDSMKLREHDEVPPANMQRVFASQSYLYAVKVERRDCRDLMRY